MVEYCAASTKGKVSEALESFLGVVNLVAHVKDVARKHETGCEVCGQAAEVGWGRDTLPFIGG